MRIYTAINLTHNSLRNVLLSNIFHCGKQFSLFNFQLESEKNTDWNFRIGHCLFVREVCMRVSQSQCINLGKMKSDNKSE